MEMAGTPSSLASSATPSSLRSTLRLGHVIVDSTRGTVTGRMAGEWLGLSSWLDVEVDEPLHGGGVAGGKHQAHGAALFLDGSSALLGTHC